MSIHKLVEGVDITMKACPTCRSSNIVHSSSILARGLLSIYILMSFFFFIGGIDYQALLALIPFFFPYKNKCLKCEDSYYSVVPGFKRLRIQELSNLERFLLGMLPSMLIITLLIITFPYTGLGRIAYLPAIYLINSTIILTVIGKSKQVRWVIGVNLTIITSLLFYPQEYLPHVIIQIFSWF